MASLTSLARRVCLLAALFVGGCAAEAPEEGTGQDEAAVATVGSEAWKVEQALKLVPDRLVGDNTWAHGEELEYGPCYRKLMTGANEGKYRFRRYETGGAFYRASAPSDRFECIDYRIVKKDWSYSIMLSGSGLDAVLRAGLGAPTDFAWDSSGGIYDVITFERGRVFVWHYDPAPDTVDSPALGAETIDSIELFDAPTDKPVEKYPADYSRMIAMYAHPDAKGPRHWDVASDSVGRFLKGEVVREEEHGLSIARLVLAYRFEKVDVHVDHQYGDTDRETVYITRKGKDADPAKAALVRCARTWPRFDPPTPFICQGL